MRLDGHGILLHKITDRFLAAKTVRRRGVPLCRVAWRLSPCLDTFSAPFALQWVHTAAGGAPAGGGNGFGKRQLLEAL